MSARHRPPLTERFDTWSIQHPHAPVMRGLLRLPYVLWRLGLGPLIGRLGARHGHLVMLTVTGRSSGEPRHTPVTAHELDGRTYLWCPYGGRSQWFRNLTANPVVTVQSHRGTQTLRAIRIEDDDEAIEVVADLRRFDVAFLRSYLADEGIDDTPEGIVRNKRQLHVRRLEPSTSEIGPDALEADLVWLWLVPLVVVSLAVMGRCRRSAAGTGPSVRTSARLRTR